MICPSRSQLGSIAKRLGLQDSSELENLLASGKADVAMERMFSYVPVGTSTWTGTSGNQLITVLSTGGKNDVVDAFYKGLLAGQSPDDVAKGCLNALASSNNVLSKTGFQMSWGDTMIKKCLAAAGMIPTGS